MRGEIELAIFVLQNCTNDSKVSQQKEHVKKNDYALESEIGDDECLHKNPLLEFVSKNSQVNILLIMEGEQSLRKQTLEANFPHMK